MKIRLTDNNNNERNQPSNQNLLYFILRNILPTIALMLLIEIFTQR